MTVDECVAALDLPRSTRVDQRIAKKLLIENSAATATDKRRVNDGVAELTWLAALKPHTIGVPVYRDSVREYLEIAILSLTLRPAASSVRLLELVHRAIPYPVLLISAQAETLTLSAAHKRHAQNEAGKVVLEDSVVVAEVGSTMADGASLSLSLSSQPRANLWALYQGWLECLEAMLAARITGHITLAATADAAATRRAALVEYERLTSQIAMIRARAARESQISRRVELNLELKRLEAALTEATKRL